MEQRQSFMGIERPPCSTLLGWQLIEYDEGRGTVRIGFDGKEIFCNTSGFIQGGIVSAMLDDTIGPVILLHTKGRQTSPTISMTTNFVAPASPGKLICEARLIHKGSSIVFVEAQLRSENGDLLATASSTNRLIDPE